MDTLFGLFDPSLEDETTSDIDDLNNDCLPTCYLTKSGAGTKCNKNKGKSKKQSLGEEPRSLSSDKKRGENTLDALGVCTPSAGASADAKSVSPCVPLNNVADTAKRKVSVNMLDRYNDWTTQQQAKPSRSAASSVGVTTKSVTDDNNAYVVICNATKNNKNRSNTDRKASQRRNTKNLNKNTVNCSLSSRCKSETLVNTFSGVGCAPERRTVANTLMYNNKCELTKHANLNIINDNTNTLHRNTVKCNNVTKKALLYQRRCSNDGSFTNKSTSCKDTYNNNTTSTDGCLQRFKAAASSDVTGACGCCGAAFSTRGCCSATSPTSLRKLVEEMRDAAGDFPTNFAESEDDVALPDHLPSEPQEGNIEYKLKLLNPNQERFKRLVSQMQWRLREGLGEAIYEIGVEDSGLLLGLSPEELSLSMGTLKRMARQLGASLTVIREKSVGDGGRTVAEVLVRKVPDDQYSIELRIAVLGSSDVGKSTLLGVLTRGELDNGRGCARLNVFRHRHEVYSGKTSSISIQTMGFDSFGNVVDGTCTRSRDYDDEDICSQSSKIVNFIDLAGDQRYLHTTAFGLSGYCPHYALLVVSAFCGLSLMAEEHLSLARAVDLPLLLVVTKTDLATPLQLQHTLASLRAALTAPPYKKVPMVVTSVDDAITCGSASHEAAGAVVPIFLVSSVTGDGLDLLKQFLFVLPPKMTPKEREKSEQEVAQFQVDEVFHVDESVVVGGLLTAGVIPHGASLMLGPFDDCAFRSVTVESIHRNKMPCRVVCAGQSASLCLSGSDTSAIRKGMKLLAPETKPAAAYYFQARVRVVSGDCGVGRGCELTAHIGNVRQTVVVAGVLGKDRIRTTDGQPSSVLLRFLRQPEYVSVGARLLLRQGGVQGVGQLQQVFTEQPHTLLKTR